MSNVSFACKKKLYWKYSFYYRCNMILPVRFLTAAALWWRMTSKWPSIFFLIFLFMLFWDAVKRISKKWEPHCVYICWNIHKTYPHESQEALLKNAWMVFLNSSCSFPVIPSMTCYRKNNLASTCKMKHVRFRHVGNVPFVLSFLLTPAMCMVHVSTCIIILYKHSMNWPAICL